MCVCESVTTITRNCVHRSSPNFVGEGSDHLQLIKFWPSSAPGKGDWDGAKIVGSALLQPGRSVRVSLSAFSFIMPAPPPYSGSIKRRCASDVCLTSDVCLSVAYVGPKSRTERPRKTKIGTEVAHVTRDSDTTFKVKRSMVNLHGAGHIVAAFRTACFL